MIIVIIIIVIITYFIAYWYSQLIITKMCPNGGSKQTSIEHGIFYHILNHSFIRKNCHISIMEVNGKLFGYHLQSIFCVPQKK